LRLSRDERLRLVERESEELSVRIQVELLSVSRSSVYYQPKPPSPAEVQLKHRIDEIYTKWPFYGSRKITAQLQLEGVEVNRKAIQRHMREMGIEGISPGPNLSKRTRDRRHLSLPLTPYHQSVSQSRVGAGYHVYPFESKLDVSGCRAGLVLTLRDQLGSGPDIGIALCLDRTRTSPGSGYPNDL
jgi:helix-turn-helix protein